MKPIMIVVADSSLVRIFTTDSASTPLQEIETIEHPEGRRHDRDMVSELPGKIQGGAGGSHAFEDRTEPKQQEIINFAKRTADYLDDARKANKLQKLLIVAAPDFLGELRKQLSEQINEHVVFELAKNLTKLKAEDIRAHLPKYLTH